MKPALPLVFVGILLLVLGCSGDKTDKQIPKRSNIESKPSVPAPNPTNAQKIQPDLHVSGTQNNHISGINSTPGHISGQ